MKLHAWLARHPRLYHALTAMGIPVLHLLGRKRGSFSRLPMAEGWTSQRDFPAPQTETFMHLYKAQKAAGRTAMTSSARSQIFAKLRRASRGTACRDLERELWSLGRARGGAALPRTLCGIPANVLKNQGTVDCAGNRSEAVKAVAQYLYQHFAATDWWPVTTRAWPQCPGAMPACCRALAAWSRANRWP